MRVMGHTFGETVAEFSERFGCARLLALSQKQAKHENVVGGVAECRLVANPPTGRFTVPLSRIKDDPYMVRNEGGDQISFRDGAAVAITLTGTTWSVLYAAIVERYGNPSRTSEQELQSFHGALFTLHRAIWELPTGVAVVALEDFTGNIPRLPLPRVTFFCIRRSQ